METHVASVARSAYFRLWRIAQLRPYLDGGALTTVVHALVISRLDHCNARLLSGVREHQHISPTLAALHWLPVRFRVDFKVLMITYKVLNGWDLNTGQIVFSHPDLPESPDTASRDG